MSDLDKTIEELEAEVKSELEEKADLKKGAAKGDAMEKPKGDVSFGERMKKLREAN